MTNDVGGRKTTDQRLMDIHERCMKAFRLAYAPQCDVREQCLEDRRFATIAGAMWAGALGDQFANRPRFEFNQLKLAIKRVFNEYRNNRITVNFRPKDDETSKELADTYAGLYRADEQTSGAQEAYDNAFDEGVGGGMGAWRLRCVYDDESDSESDIQRIAIEPITDADTCVFFDADAKRQDKADATKCWVILGFTTDAYDEEYPDNPGPATFPKPEVGYFDWFKPDVTYIAEYYELTQRKDTVYVYEGLTGEEERLMKDDLTPEKIAELEATGYKLTRTKKIKVPQVHKYIVNGAEVIEDCGVIAGRCIPVVPFYGQRWFIDSIEWCEGMVRPNKDGARLFNMQMSRLAEIAAMSTIEKPIVTPEQVAGHEVLWSEDNISNNPYLLLNPVLDGQGNPMPAGPMGYTKPPQVPPALAATIQITGQLMKEMLGNQEAGEKMDQNQSGVAVELIQKRLDMQTFIYLDNAAKAMKRSGEIYYWMAKDVYVEEKRKLKTVNVQGESEFIEIMKPAYDAKTATAGYENDLSSGRCEVWVDVGPSFTSRRDSTVRSLLAMMQTTQDPELLNLIGSTALMNMDGEGLDDIQAFLRKQLVRKGVVKPTDDEKAEMAEEQANTPPDPNAEYLKAAAAEAAAKGMKAQADTGKAVADTEKAKAETASILASIPIDRQRAAMESAKSIVSMLTPQETSGAPAR